MQKHKPIQIVGELPEGVSTLTVEPGVKVRQTIGYVRVSSRSTERQQLSPGVQRQIIHDFCRRNGLGVPVIIEERQSAATIRKRPELVRVLEMCRAGQVKHVVVQDLTRLFRDVREALDVFHEMEGRKYDITFHNASQPNLDTTTADGEFVRGLGVLLGHRERRIMGERIQRVLRATKKVHERDKDINPAMRARYDKGQILNGGEPFGYRYRKRRNQYPGRTILERCPVNYPILLRIHELRKGGLSAKKIAMLLLGERVRGRKGRRHDRIIGRHLVARVLNRGWV